MKSVLDVRTIIQSIYKWNAARYEQEGLFGITADLLQEEFNELEGAPNAREVCDAYADIFFVAIGGCWKVGLTVDEVRDMPSHPAPPLNLCIDWFIQAPSVYALRTIADTVLNSLQNWLGYEAALKVLDAICNSNHTKEVKKTASNMKANIYKGLKYISPAEDLDRILIEQEINPIEKLDKVSFGGVHEHA